jgi:hypothetical protein
VTSDSIRSLAAIGIVVGPPFTLSISQPDLLHQR